MLLYLALTFFVSVLINIVFFPFPLQLCSPWRFPMADGHLSLPNSAAAAPAVWTPRLLQPLDGPAAAPACHPAPRQLARQDPMMAVHTLQRIYCTTGIKVKDIKLMQKHLQAKKNGPLCYCTSAYWYLLCVINSQSEF